MVLRTTLRAVLTGVGSFRLHHGGRPTVCEGGREGSGSANTLCRDAQLWSRVRAIAPIPGLWPPLIVSKPCSISPTGSHPVWI